MVRPSKKGGKKVMFYLSEETIESIKISSGIHDLSMSGYIDFIISNARLSENPMKKLKIITSKKEELQERVRGLEIEEKKAIENASKEHEWQEELRKQKPKAIQAIMKALLRNDTNLAQEYAKTWQTRTSTPAIELISEAMSKLKNSGV